MESKGYHQTTDRGVLRFLQPSEIDDEMRQIPGLDGQAKSFGTREAPHVSKRSSRRSAGRHMMVSSVVAVIAIIAALLLLFS